LSGIILHDLFVKVFLKVFHPLLEVKLPLWFESKLISRPAPDDLVWDVCQVEEHHDHIGLFAPDFPLLFNELVVVFLYITKAVLNELLSLGNEGPNVVKIVGVLAIR
jgi:hypothetical protein